jgi:hypothetical protein
MNFLKFGKKQFSSYTKNVLKTEFNLTNKELRNLNNEMKLPWVKPGWDKIVKKTNNILKK